MKKLMVVAAAAALTGVAVAEDYVMQPSIYDLTISVKSTTGKAGKGSEKAYTVNLGKNSSNKFWYEDACVWDGSKGQPANILNLSGEQNRTFAIKGASETIYKRVVKVTYKGKNYSKLKDKPVLDLSKLDDKAKTDIAEAFGFDGKNTRYNKQSDKQWCSTFGYNVIVPDRCYRVAKSYTFKYLVASEECCGQKPYQFEVFDADTENIFADVPLFPIETIMLYRFNAAKLEKANKVEYIGKVGNFAKADEQWAWAFAGQGDWSDSLTFKYYDGNNKKQKQSYSGVKSLSGNIVGSLPPATCEGCCGIDDQAIAFTCDALNDDDIAWKVAEDEEMLNTAMFGTFSLKWKKCWLDQY